MFSLIPAGELCVVGGGRFFCKKFFFYVILKLCAEFQFPTMSTTGQKVCGGGGGVVVVWWWWLKPTLVFSLAQAEQKFMQELKNIKYLFPEQYSIVHAPW